MNLAILVDFVPDEKDKSLTHIHIHKVDRIDPETDDIILSDENDDPISLMACLCEAICTLIHVADNEKIKPSYESVKDCIQHITNGFADASYKGFMIKNE